MNSSISNSNRLFASYVTAFAVVLVSLVGATEWLIRSQVVPEDALYKHVALFDATTSTQLALGDSHVARGFNPSGTVINLAYPSENIEKMTWKMGQYLDAQPALDTVLLQADPHLFSAYRTNAGLGDYPRIFSDRNLSGLLSMSETYRPRLIALWQAFFLNKGALRAKVEPTATGGLLSPGDLSQWNDQRIDLFMDARLRYHAPPEDFKTSDVKQQYEQLIVQLIKSGAQVCLVSFPVSTAYSERIAGYDGHEAVQWQLINTFFKDLAAHPSIAYFDHRSLYDNPALFRDPDHLNKKGALLYSTYLQDACFGSEPHYVAGKAE